jgi:hypothetical protein
MEAVSNQPPAFSQKIGLFLGAKSKPVIYPIHHENGSRKGVKRRLFFAA